MKDAMREMKDQPRRLGLATDLYQLTMGAAYHAHGRHERVSFELFVRKLPPQRSYLVLAGIEQALAYLHDLSFSAVELEYLKSLPVFAKVSSKYFEFLRDLRFTGEVWAAPEGTVVFAGEPLLRVTAPMIEAQMVETNLLATINFQTLIATKAARVVEAARGRDVIEFGARRCHGFDAAIYAARAAFIGGCIGTSNLEAGKLFDLPVFGTAAHSFTMAFEREIDAFRAYHQIFPENTTLLIDTYDTIAGAREATKIGPQVRGVRLDSGDLSELSKKVRKILDEAGMEGTKIIASGDLDEFKIARLLSDGAPIDQFGVGTELSTSRDAPALGGVYKMVEVEYPDHLEPKMKLSEEKATYPYRKQVWRESDEDGAFIGDTIGIANEQGIKGEKLLNPVMQSGKSLAALPSLKESQVRAQAQLLRLPAKFKAFTDAEDYPVRYSDKLQSQRQEILARLKYES